MSRIISGEDMAWEILAGMEPDEVCRKSGADFDREMGLYILKSYGSLFSVDPHKKVIMNLDQGGLLFLGRLKYFFGLSMLWYLVKATDVKPSGRLIKPSGMPGGDIFFRGSHVLPLEGIASKYRNDKAGFISRGIAYAGKEVSFGDSAIELYAAPKIPVTLILWLEDEEWPARADILFDSTVINHLPVDVIWSIAMMSVLIFL